MYSEINLDLQSFAKRVYENYLYQSTFYNFLNPAYIGELRQTGAPVIEVGSQNPTQAHIRATKEIVVENLMEELSLTSKQANEAIEKYWEE